jgi:oxygen-independent coproporphyrinogen-3 oxidase
VRRYVAALIADLEQDLPLAWGRSVHSVFFGGGTPSLFPPARSAHPRCLLAPLRFAPSAEITMECNPGTAEHGRFEATSRAGVNRVSFGVQSFDDGCLQRLGRIHDSARPSAR